VGGVWSGDRFETGCDVPELHLVQPAGEVLPDPPQVGAGGAPEPLRSLFREARMDDPRILAVRPTSHQSLRDQPIDQSRQPAGGEEDPLGQIGHAQRSVRSAGQPEEDVVGGEREVVLLSELPVELPDDLVVGMEERLPRPHLGLGDPSGSHMLRLEGRTCICKEMGVGSCVCKYLPEGDRIATADVVAGFSLGIALAGAPGPVQAVLLAEAVRGGIPRGLRALGGAGATFGVLLVSLSLGLSLTPPTGTVLRILQAVGGAFLLWLAVEAFRSGNDVARPAPQGRALHPTARGALAVLLNPGAWLFLGAVASPLFAAAGQRGGTLNALFVAVALMVGLATGDMAVVLLGGLGLRRGGQRVGRWVRRALAAVLAGLGVWLLVIASIP
jgi:threonine/homoserine/homoserine lactone efflux protein